MAFLASAGNHLVYSLHVDVVYTILLFFFGGDIYEVTWGKHIAYVGIRWYELEVVGF